jgi:hypothetical protein
LQRANRIEAAVSSECVRCLLDARHVSAFSDKDVYRPVHAQHSIDLVSYLDIAHIFASGKASDFLERHAL